MKFIFGRVEGIVLKDKILVTSIFSFRHCFLKPFLSGMFNSLPNNKILDGLKFKAFADDKRNVTEKDEIDFGKGRTHCGKRTKCWLPAFSPFPTMFSKGLKVIRSRDCVVKCQTQDCVVKS